MRGKLLNVIDKRLKRSIISSGTLGLVGGKLGICIFEALYSEETQNSNSRKKSIALFNEIVVNYESLPDTFLSGKVGLGWGMLLLSKHAILELDDKVQNLLNQISHLSSYSLNGHPYQLSLDDKLFVKGIYKLQQMPSDQSLLRFVIDEELIAFVDDCENLLFRSIKHIYNPKHLSLRELNSILYFLKEIENRRIFPFKARILIEKVNDLYKTVNNKSLVDEIVFQILYYNKYNLSHNNIGFYDKLSILGELGFLSLIYEDCRLFFLPFQHFKQDDVNFEQKLIRILKRQEFDLSVLCGLGFGLLNLKNISNEKN